MIKEFGRITKIEAGGVWVTTIQQSTCNSCQAKHGCGQKLLNQLGVATSSIRANVGTAIDPAELTEGDWIEIGVAEGAVVTGSLLAYGLPVLLLVVGAALGQNDPLTSILGAAFGLAVGASVSRAVLHSCFGPQYFQPIVLSKGLNDQRVKLITS